METLQKGGVNIKKTAQKRLKHLLKTAICAGRQSHPRNKEPAFYRCVKCLEPPCGQEKTFGRGVRSDVQLSCTETQLQKCSQSGKNGSKHPMLSISMAFNVISCKKVERNTQKLKIADFTM